MSEKITVGRITTPCVLTARPLPTTKFDGWEFYQPTDAKIIPFLYLASQARRGDPLAIEVLTAFKVSIMDIHGAFYWPPEQADEPAIVTTTI